MISQDKFLIIFYLRGVFGFPLVSKEKATALQKSAGSQFSAFRLPGVHRSRSLYQRTESQVN